MIEFDSDSPGGCQRKFPCAGAGEKIGRQECEEKACQSRLNKDTDSNFHNSPFRVAGVKNSIHKRQAIP
jgi:hypothetical protein